jgi:excisionase family DNA binding protein
VSHLVVALPAETVEELVERVAERVVKRLGRANCSPWLTRAQAAQYTGLPLSRLEKDRTIPCHRDGRRVLYHRDELDAHLLAC